MIKNTPMLDFIIKNAIQSLPFKDVFILTGDDVSCDPIVSIASEYNVSALRGAEAYPVLRTSQVITTLTKLGFTHLCRICGDSPFYPFKCLEQLFAKACNQYQELSDSLCINNTMPKTYPNGASVEFYPLNVIVDTVNKFEGLHYSDSLTDIIKKQSKFLHFKYSGTYNVREYPLTIDTSEDVQIALRNYSTLTSLGFYQDFVVNSSFSLIHNS